METDAVDAQEDEVEDEDVAADEGCELYPWEHHELVCRELLNCFDAKTVVHYNTGCSWPLACARHSRHFVGFARNEAHAQHVHKTLIAMVVAEIIEGKQDGFSARRFLSAQRSLGGSTEDASVNQPGASAPSEATAGSEVAAGEDAASVAPTWAGGDEDTSSSSLEDETLEARRE